MSNEQTPTRAGDVKIKTATITNGWGLVLDIIPQLHVIELYENMFESFITGTMVIRDDQNISNLFPLVGNEYIDLEFMTPGFEGDSIYSGRYYIYNCSDRQITSQRDVVYTLKFITAEGYFNTIQRVSRTFRGTPSDIIQDIVHKPYGLNSQKNILVEQTSNNITFISNWWHPARCINYACERSLNTNGSSSYLFFETKAGFVFSSLHDLIGDGTDQPYQRFKINNKAKAPANNINSTITNNIVEDYQAILDIKYHTGFDFFERSASGYYGSEVIAYDTATQQYIHSRNGRNFEDDNHLNHFNPVASISPGCTSTNIEYIPYQSLNFDGCNNGITDTDVPFRAAREQTLSQLKTTCLDIRVWGRTDYSVGLVVEVLLPKQQQINPDDTNVYDNVSSGRYLITALKHIISPTQHVCNIQLMKDSYCIDLDKGGYQDSQSQNKDSK